MANESQCPRFSNVFELELHVVQDCMFPKIVWRAVVPSQD